MYSIVYDSIRPLQISFFFYSVTFFRIYSLFDLHRIYDTRARMHASINKIAAIKIMPQVSRIDPFKAS